MNVIDLFAGAGGFSSGFIKAGFKIVLANEIDKMIANTYKKNHTDTLMINEDIKEFVENTEKLIEESCRNTEERLSEINEKLKNVKVIIGGPPCQGFSMAGARIRSTGFIEDPRNYLFKSYFEVIKKFEPDYFVFENVQGLTTLNNGEILNTIIDIFSDETNFTTGKYFVSKKIISANELGVPQKRKRLILIGSKHGAVDIDLEIEEIKKQFKIRDNVTLRDAISDLNYLESGEGDFQQEYVVETLSHYQMELRNSKFLFNHVAGRHNKVALDRIKQIKGGENWSNLKDEVINSVHSGAYGRLSWDSPAYTITTRFDTPSAGRVIHPDLNRVLTPREAARIQSFDDNYIFYGNKTSIGKQIGNAVPPRVAWVIAEIIKRDILKNNNASRRIMKMEYR